MAKLCVIKRVIVTLEAPEIAAHILESLKVCLFGKFEFLLEIDDLLPSFNLKQLCLANFDHHLVTVWPLD